VIPDGELSSMNNPALQIHGDARTFMEMVRTTSDQSGFDARLVEKDYYCSLLLQQLCDANGPLVFKGGTCISKVFSSFYRLSEDLDFCIPGAESRAARRRRIDPIKKAVGIVPERIEGLKIVDSLTGRNVSTQYVAQVEYTSSITNSAESIKIEVGLREPLTRAPESRTARTLLKDSFSGQDVIPPFSVKVMNEQEAWAEKARAALCRLEPVIRDFFDLDYARNSLAFDLEDAGFFALLRHKISAPGNNPVVLTVERRAELERQIEGQLRPVLRSRDFEQFDLDRIWTALVTLAKGCDF
jgi:predicted nucleotidyltransferase component of viral defense system